MVILHILSQNHLTGSEVYASSLIDWQIKNQHKVYQISNGFYYPTQAQTLTLPVETKSRSEFKNSQEKLIEFIRAHQIQVIHSHSRAAAKLAHAASCKTKVAHVSTLHGRQHTSWSKRLFNIYGQYQIAICENIKDQLVSEFKYTERKIKIIRNGIDTTAFNYKAFKKTADKEVDQNARQNTATKTTEKIKVAIIGRATGPKKNRTEVFLTEFSQLLNAKNIKYEFHLIGADKKDLSDHVVNQLADHIVFTPYLKLNSDVLHQYDLIVGSGRVCMEALLSGVSTIAFGEYNYEGLLTSKNIEHVLKSNFGDIGVGTFEQQPFNTKTAQEDLELLLWRFQDIDASELKRLSEISFNLFSVDRIAQKVYTVYRSAILSKHCPKWIPILMYHKIPKQELNSPHKIFVTENNFDNHLTYFSNWGLQTITLNDLADYSHGKIDLKKFPKNPLILTFDDGYKDNLENASPLLKKYNSKAQLFLLADKTVKHNQWDEKDLQQGDLIVSGAERQQWLTSQFEIGSHGLSHDRITQMTETDAITELVSSKKSLESEFKTPIKVYAYTYGDTNQACAELAESAGYDLAVNTDTGGIDTADDLYQIFRVNIFPDETYLSLWKKTSSWYRKYYFWKRKK